MVISHLIFLLCDFRRSQSWRQEDERQVFATGSKHADFLDSYVQGKLSLPMTTTGRWMGIEKPWCNLQIVTIIDTPCCGYKPTWRVSLLSAPPRKSQEQVQDFLSRSNALGAGGLISSTPKSEVSCHSDLATLPLGQPRAIQCMKAATKSTTAVRGVWCFCRDTVYRLDSPGIKALAMVIFRVSKETEKLRELVSNPFSGLAVLFVFERSGYLFFWNTATSTLVIAVYSR